MARINQKTGLPYVKNIRFSEQDKWLVSYREATNLIRHDPDLTPKQKQQAIIKLAHALDGNTREERLRILNTLYKKAHGVNANTNTPMSEFVKAIIIRKKNF